jgi:hypothetical protein
MKLFFLALFVAVCPFMLFGQSSGKKTPLPPHPNGPASQEIQTETIGPQRQKATVPSAQASTTGYLEPAQVKALMHKIWLVQYRLSDLLAQVHPEKWKMPPAVRQSFGQSLESLRKSMAAEEDWRGQFDARPDSLYLGFQTYVAISAVLPRVDGVARSVSLYENASFGGQYAQAANQLFDLQQLLEPHLTYLLKNQDNVLLIAQTNLAACQNELNFAEHDKEGHATPMKNIAPVFKGRNRTAHTTTAAGGAKSPGTKGTAAGKPRVHPAIKPQDKKYK